MIIQGDPADNGAFWAAHLTNAQTNEKVEIIEVRGVTATDLREAFREMQLLARGSGARGSVMYQANINPQPWEHLNAEQWRQSVDALETKLGFAGHPRVVLRHVKNGREHTHVVWSRVDKTLRVVNPYRNYYTQMETARALERAFGLEPPTPRGPGHAKAYEMWEFSRGEETGINPRAVRAELTALWRQSDGGRAFVAALHAQGYVLARGDRQPFVVIDHAGTLHGLARRLEGVTTAEIRAALASLDPATLPSIAAARGEQQRRFPDAGKAWQERGQVDMTPACQPAFSRAIPPRVHTPGTPDWALDARMVSQHRSAVRYLRRSGRHARLLRFHPPGKDTGARPGGAARSADVSGRSRAAAPTSPAPVAPSASGVPLHRLSPVERFEEMFGRTAREVLTPPLGFAGASQPHAGERQRADRTPPRDTRVRPLTVAAPEIAAAAPVTDSGLEGGRAPRDRLAVPPRLSAPPRLAAGARAPSDGVMTPARLPVAPRREALPRLTVDGARPDDQGARPPPTPARARPGVLQSLAGLLRGRAAEPGHGATSVAEVSPRAAPGPALRPSVLAPSAPAARLPASARTVGGATSPSQPLATPPSVTSGDTGWLSRIAQGLFLARDGRAPAGAGSGRDARAGAESARPPHLQVGAATPARSGASLAASHGALAPCGPAPVEGSGAPETAPAPATPASASTEYTRLGRLVDRFIGRAATGSVRVSEPGATPAPALARPAASGFAPPEEPRVSGSILPDPVGARGPATDADPRLPVVPVAPPPRTPFRPPPANVAAAERLIARNAARMPLTASSEDPGAPPARRGDIAAAEALIARHLPRDPRAEGAPPIRRERRAMPERGRRGRSSEAGGDGVEIER